MIHRLINPELEWSVLAQIASGYLGADAVQSSWLTGDRRVTLARLRAGTTETWEQRAFDLLPALPATETAERVQRLRDLAERRKLLNALQEAANATVLKTLSVAEIRNLLQEAVSAA